MKTSPRLWISPRTLLNPPSKNGKAKQVCYNHQPVELRETGAIVQDNNPKHATAASFGWFSYSD